jgi:hypothetical protein
MRCKWQRNLRPSDRAFGRVGDYVIHDRVGETAGRLLHRRLKQRENLTSTGRRLIHAKRQGGRRGTGHLPNDRAAADFATSWNPKLGVILMSGTVPYGELTWPPWARSVFSAAAAFA